HQRLLGARDPGNDHSRRHGRGGNPASDLRPHGRRSGCSGLVMKWRRLSSNGEWALLVVLGAETLLFSAIAPSFFTLGNFFEMTRFSVELGLLAVALTPVIVAGGIDLSVGSMMGLAAVSFEAGYHAWHLALPIEAAGVVLLDGDGGAQDAPRRVQ